MQKPCRRPFSVLLVFLLMIQDDSGCWFKYVDVQHSSLGCFKVLFQVKMLAIVDRPKSHKSIQKQSCLQKLQISKKWRMFITFCFSDTCKSGILGSICNEPKQTWPFVRGVLWSPLNSPKTFAKFDISVQAYQSSGQRGWCKFHASI